MFDRLKSAAAALDDRRIEDLFAADPARAERFSVQALGMVFDYSKTQINAEIARHLTDLAEKADLDAARDAMFTGKAINTTENRAVLHTALRAPATAQIHVDGQDVVPAVHETLDRMRALAQTLRAGTITDVVNIGIGGSDLGPAMAVRALRPYHDGPRCHFVSNVDGADIADTLDGLRAETTLFIIASKTFTTIETMTNAETAKAWLQAAGVDVSERLVALSSAVDKAVAFGVPEARVFGFADWVGGRYSVWGPIGLSLMIAIGPSNFNEFLAGAQAMDDHFRSAAWSENMPVMLALVGIWHAQIMGYETRAVLPYDDRMARLPAYLQQLEMESNGKRVALDGTPLTEASGPIVWGEPGTNGQHAFYQLLHQGTRIVPCEFMVAAQSHEPDLAHHHDLLVANCLAQAEALMRGRDLETARGKVPASYTGAAREAQAQHRVFPGNRPSTMLAYRKLTPRVLGQIIALYEHRVFVEGVVLGINSFDQWGVELGKELATTLGPMVRGEIPPEGKDGSTARLIQFVLENR